jgi:hypothetical protein
MSPTIHDVQMGDVGFCRGRGFMSWAIREAQKRPGEAPSWANHTVLFTYPGSIGRNIPRAHQAHAIEALWHVEHNPWWERHREEDGYTVQVFRPLFLDWDDAPKVVDNAMAHLGARYGWWKLGFHLTDRVLFDGDRKLSRFLHVDSRPICSYLVAQAFADAGYPEAFGTEVPPQAQDPDDQHDHVTSGLGRWAFVGEYQIKAEAAAA